jgi:hypothetical protein
MKEDEPKYTANCKTLNNTFHLLWLATTSLENSRNKLKDNALASFWDSPGRDSNCSDSKTEFIPVGFPWGSGGGGKIQSFLGCNLHD